MLNLHKIADLWSNRVCIMEVIISRIEDFASFVANSDPLLAEKVGTDGHIMAVGENISSLAFFHQQFVVAVNEMVGGREQIMSSENGSKRKLLLFAQILPINMNKHVFCFSDTTFSPCGMK